jgi:hypothetical protein
MDGEGIGRNANRTCTSLPKLFDDASQASAFLGVRLALATTIQGKTLRKRE